jgi:hypothetical protein
VEWRFGGKIWGPDLALQAPRTPNRWRKKMLGPSVFLPPFGYFFFDTFRISKIAEITF